MLQLSIQYTTLRDTLDTQKQASEQALAPVSYTHLRAHET